MGVKSFPRGNPSKKQIEIYNDFSGGLNTELADSATKDNQFRKLINFDMDAAGALIKRPGLYRIPFVKTIIEQKAKHLIASNIISFENWRDLEIKDVQQFFDGIHWVFNYITTCGLFVLILDSNMNVPQDLEYEEYCLHYPLSVLKENPSEEELENEIGDKIKISQYGSIYVMYATQYSNSTGIINTNKKQVRLFSWNPIKDDDQTIDGKPARPGWIEASDSGDEVDDLIYYGETETKTINSNKLDFSDIPNQTFDIKPGKYIPSFLNDDSIYQYSVEYKTNNVDLSWLEITTNGVKEQFNITNGNGDTISPRDILTITLNTDGKIVVYFNKLLNNKHQQDGVWYSFARTLEVEFDLQHKEKGFYFDFTKNRIAYEYVEVAPFRKDWKITNVKYKDNTFSTFFSYTYTTPGGPNGPQHFTLYYESSNIYKLLWKNEDYNSLKINAELVLDDVNNIYFTQYSPLFNYNITIKKYTNSIGMSFSKCFDKNNKNFLSIDDKSSSINFSCITTYLPLMLKTNDNNIIIGNILDDSVALNNNVFNFYYDFNYTYIYTFYTQGFFYKEGDFYEGFLNNKYYYWDRIKPLKPTNDLSYKNIVNKNNTLALATGTYFVDNKNVIPIRHTKNSFYFEKLTISNLSKWMNLNQIENEYITRKPILGSLLFSKDKIDELKEQYLKDNIISLDFNANYIYNGEQKYLKTDLKEYEINDFLNAILHDDISTPRLYLDVLKINNVISVINFIWVDDIGKEHLLCELNENTLGIVPQEILDTLYFNFTYKQLIGGRVDIVLNFKQQRYVKPNLNDLQYLWYNMVLFSRFGSSRWPDIYDSKVHPNISWDLVEYPNVDDTQQTNYIQLFGIVPVNNVILAPGKQRFQLFYNLRDDVDKARLQIALTAMSIKDYNQMINSPDYSTSGYKNNSSGDETNNRTTGPNWIKFDDLFLKENSEGVDEGLDDDKVWNEEKQEWEPKPKKAIFEVDVPTTTQPYMILIQVAQLKEKQPNLDERIDLSKVVETRIEMQPNSSYIDKINSKSLFDEFTTTTNLYTYSTNLVMYGSTNKIYFSDNTVPSYFPLSRIIEIKTPEAIKSCTTFQNKLIVSTENSRWYIGGSSFDSEQDPYYIKNVSTDSGILAPKSDTPMGNYLYFLDNTGIKVLKNLYGTADKEFAYETIDSIISTQVPRDIDACGCAYNNKYYLCFPNYKYMLVYNESYKAWVSYQSNYLNFTKMFVNDGILYGIDKDTFAIYRFDRNVFVDDWNEIEDGYEEITNVDGIKQKVQKGKPITCYMETKNLDQNYTPHRKKYDWALLEATINGIDGTDIKGVTKPLIPYIKIDDDLVNYKIDYHSLSTNDDTTWMYVENNEPYGIIIRDDSTLDKTSIIGFNRLGNNNNGTFYHIPIRRKGNSVAFGFSYDAPCGLTIKSLSIKYGLQDIRKNRGGQS